ncbi:uncharacterized protein LOC130495624 [Raphanus sativus]|uniref:Uncharacterized protein LOC130495624 n=1 Tax=Raphanus sativus TaxID=3726 RepID=A0A9W3BUR2_RAPSA|nr:uncharacterized protein LOC130495624 [Raphanus sativus]
MLDTDKPLFYCEVCRGNTSTVTPKYKLHVFVKDDTGSCHLMLLDSVAKTIIGDEAKELWDGSYPEIEDPELIPISVRNLVGKSFCFGISIKSDNITNGSDTFKVSEVFCLDQNREISEDVSTPYSKRKEGDAELNDPCSTSKKLCSKSIKIEKIKED